MLPDLPTILEALIGHGVEFVMIGGMAAVIEILRETLRLKEQRGEREGDT